VIALGWFRSVRGGVFCVKFCRPVSLSLSVCELSVCELSKFCCVLSFVNGSFSFVFSLFIVYVFVDPLLVKDKGVHLQLANVVVCV
jgi:hypothetical protein